MSIKVFNTSSRHYSSRDLLLASHGGAASDEVGGFFRDHDDGGVGVAGDYGGHDGGVRHTQPADAFDPEHNRTGQGVILREDNCSK